MWKRRDILRAGAAIIVTAAVFVGTSCSSGGEPETIAEPERLAFVHASVIPMDRERVLPDQTVIVAVNRILEIGPTQSTEIPEGVTQIDATGRYLIPAFCDMHVHLLGDAWNIMLPPEAQIPIDDLDRASFLFPYVANGITTVQVLSATEDHIALRERIARGEILGSLEHLGSLAGRSERGRSRRQRGGLRRDEGLFLSRSGFLRGDHIDRQRGRP
jgi:imidazolonepropionase-like amidohydrolase